MHKNQALQHFEAACSPQVKLKLSRLKGNISSWKHSGPDYLRLDFKIYEEFPFLSDTGENEPKCAVYFRPGTESYSSFGLLNYFLWWGEVNSVVALCTLWLKFACGQVSSPRLHRLLFTVWYQKTDKVNDFHHITLCGELIVINFYKIES